MSRLILRRICASLWKTALLCFVLLAGIFCFYLRYRNTNMPEFLSYLCAVLPGGVRSLLGIRENLNLAQPAAFVFRFCAPVCVVSVVGASLLGAGWAGSLRRCGAEPLLYDGGSLKKWLPLHLLLSAAAFAGMDLGFVLLGTLVGLPLHLPLRMALGYGCVALYAWSVQMWSYLIGAAWSLIAPLESRWGEALTLTTHLLLTAVAMLIATGTLPVGWQSILPYSWMLPELVWLGWGGISPVLAILGGIPLLWCIMAGILRIRTKLRTYRA